MQPSSRTSASQQISSGEVSIKIIHAQVGDSPELLVGRLSAGEVWVHQGTNLRAVRGTAKAPSRRAGRRRSRRGCGTPGLDSTQYGPEERTFECLWQSSPRSERNQGYPRLPYEAPDKTHPAGLLTSDVTVRNSWAVQDTSPVSPEPPLLLEGLTEGGILPETGAQAFPAGFQRRVTCDRAEPPRSPSDLRRRGRLRCDHLPSVGSIL